MQIDGISAVLFDFGLVLSGPPAPGSWTSMKTLLNNIEEKPFHETYWKYRDEYDKGTLSGTDYWRAIASDHGITLSDAQLKELKSHDVDLWTDLNTPMVEWAQRLQESGLRTGVLSNIGDAMAEGICAKFIWIAGFTHCVWSHALKLRKPEPEIYKHASEGLGVPPAEILFIDDRAINIEAAEKAGMKAILYSNFEQFEQDMRAAGYRGLLTI